MSDLDHVALRLHPEERLRLIEENVQDYAIFVIDTQGRIAYAEYVADQMREPDYDAAIAAARRAAG